MSSWDVSLSKKLPVQNRMSKGPCFELMVATLEHMLRRSPLVEPTTSLRILNLAKKGP